MTELNDRPLFSLTVGEFIELQKKCSHSNEFFNSKQQDTEKELLSIQDASILLQLSIATLYSMNSRRQIPFIKVTGKVYYRRTVLYDWLNGSLKRTTAQIMAEGVTGGIKR